MKKFIFLSIIICASLTTGAQVSRYLEKGQSGIGLRIGSEKTYGMYGFSGQIGGSIKGIIDIEVSYTKDLYDQTQNDLLDNNASSSLYEGWVNWWVIRKQIIPAIDVNVALWGEYANSPYKNYRTIDTDTTQYLYKSYQEGQFGFEISVNFRITDTWWLQPGFFAYYAVGQEKWDEKALTVKNNYQGVGSSLELGIVKRIRKSSLYLQFNQYFDSYEASTNKYKLSIGYILGL